MSPSIGGAGLRPPAGRGEEEEGGSLLGRKDGCSLGALGFAVLGPGDELQISKLLFQVQSIKGIGLHIWLS